jgi:hypothetical protein
MTPSRKPLPNLTYGCRLTKFGNGKWQATVWAVDDPKTIEVSEPTDKYEALGSIPNLMLRLEKP